MISNREIVNRHTFTGTTILITSPILLKDSKTKWKGIFSGVPIDFSIEDKSFLNQVFNKEIHFQYGMTIKCSLEKIVVTKYDNSGKIANEKVIYIVKDVNSWSYDDEYHYETKSYKKKRHQPQELELQFVDND